MFAKWLGALLVLAAAAAWGERQAIRLRRRVVELEEFRLALRLLMAEIGYTATPLPRALEYVASRLKGSGVRSFFTEVRIQLAEPGLVDDASTAWSRVAAVKQETLALEADDWAVLTRVAAGLGALGRDDQVRQLELADAQLSSLATEATEVCRRGEKMWRYLGVFGGLAIVILLL
ncbi:MAG: stage III sporulation protein AB [Clostridiales bacterium]|jgi:stage III sporulation protein AB|nr:stage III sporulation protein AB [Clostridiales bacterium]